MELSLCGIHENRLTNKSPVPSEREVSWSNVCLFFLKISFIFYREEKGRRKRGRDINVQKKHQLVASHTCSSWGPGLQPRPVH